MQSQGGLRKVYVQDVIRENAPLLIDVILKGKGALAVAGGAKMASGVRKEVARIFGEALGGDEVMGERILEGLKKKGRYVVESWT